MARLRVVLAVLCSGLTLYVCSSLPASLYQYVHPIVDKDEIEIELPEKAVFNDEDAPNPYLNPSPAPTADGYLVTSAVPSEPDPDPTLHQAVLILSSVGRSGSSFLGEVLASKGENIYLYEPIRALPRSQWRNRTLIQDELKRNFHCEMRRELLSSHKTPYQAVRHPSTLRKAVDDIRLDKLQYSCSQEPTRIIKTIRTRLEWTFDLLKDPHLKLKVVHLVRDPRGSMVSMRGVQWKNSIRDTCTNILVDLLRRDEMQRRFPDQYFFLKYEDFCRDPHTFTRLILDFIDGVQTLDPRPTYERDPGTQAGLEEIHTKEKEVKINKIQIHKGRGNFRNLPMSVYRYLDTHTRVNPLSPRSPWSTVRDTSAVYQLWRKKMRQVELTAVEEECKDVIDKLGHRLFGNVKMARDMKISLFLNDTSSSSSIPTP